MGELLARATRRAAVAHVRHVSPVAPSAAGGLVAEVYRQIERDFGMLAPPVSLHSPAPEVLAACWLMLRESLIASHPSPKPGAGPETTNPRIADTAGLGSPQRPVPPRDRTAAAASTPGLARAPGITTAPGAAHAGTSPRPVSGGVKRLAVASREAKEAVAAAVSLANRCPYCAEVHGTTLMGLVRSPDAAAIAEGRIDTVSDPSLRALARWAYSSDEPPPFGPELVPEFVGVAVTFQYLNRMVNLFLQDSLLPSGMPKSARRRISSMAARIMGSLARDARPPGESIRLLPEAPLPHDMAWARGTPIVSDAFARASGAIERAGERSVPDAVRSLVTTWTGGGPGFSAQEWLRDATADLSKADRPAGRLAMLTAYASHQVGPSLIGEFRKQHPDDHTLIELAAWASLRAARRIGARSI